MSLSIYVDAIQYMYIIHLMYDVLMWITSTPTIAAINHCCSSLHNHKGKKSKVKKVVKLKP